MLEPEIDVDGLEVVPHLAVDELSPLVTVQPVNVLPAFRGAET